jgi:hypothetical protein
MKEYEQQEIKYFEKSGLVSLKESLDVVYLHSQSNWLRELIHAQVAKSVDARSSEGRFFGSGGSTPLLRTKADNSGIF